VDGPPHFAIGGAMVNATVLQGKRPSADGGTDVRRGDSAWIWQIIPRVLTDALRLIAKR